MDEAVTPRVLPGLFLLAGMALSPMAASETLRDPTRPPSNLTAAGSVAAVPGAAALPQLQSVLIARHAGGRHLAVIDGKTVRLGEKFKGALLVSVTETQVVLVQGNQRQVLRLYPATAMAAQR